MAIDLAFELLSLVNTKNTIPSYKYPVLYVELCILDFDIDLTRIITACPSLIHILTRVCG